MVLDSAFMWPQALKMIRTRDISGVSALTWAFGLIFSVAWAVYAWHVQMWALMGSNVACAAAAGVAVGQGTRLGWPRLYASGTVAGVGASVLLVAVSPVALVTVLAVGAVLFAVPQFVAIVRSPSVSGVSAATWWLNILVSSSWLTVGAYEGAMGVAGANAVSILALAAVLVALYMRRILGYKRASS